MMVVAAWAGSVLAWDRELAGLKERIGCVFSRMELRRNAGAFIDGLLSGIERKTGWLIAGHRRGPPGHDAGAVRACVRDQAGDRARPDRRCAGCRRTVRL